MTWDDLAGIPVPVLVLIGILAAWSLVLTIAILRVMGKNTDNRNEISAVDRALETAEKAIKNLTTNQRTHRKLIDKVRLDLGAITRPPIMPPVPETQPQKAQRPAPGGRHSATGRQLPPVPQARRS